MALKPRDNTITRPSAFIRRIKLDWTASCQKLLFCSLLLTNHSNKYKKKKNKFEMQAFNLFVTSSLLNCVMPNANNAERETEKKENTIYQKQFIECICGYVVGCASLIGICILCNAIALVN